MRKTLKKSFAVLMVIFMLIGAIPFTVLAATTQVSNLSGLQSALAGAANGDVIDVTADISLTAALTVDKQVTIKSSNGSTIRRSSSYSSYMIVVANGGALTLEDITVNGNRTSTATADLARELIVVQTGGTLNFNDGAVLTTNRANTLVSGAGITVAGTLNINGGNIVNLHLHNSSNATVMYGAAITVSGGTVNMYGGMIGGPTFDNATQNDGRNGAVGVVSGTFNMYGGTISGNVANQQGGGAGGVHISAGATFNMYDGLVANNNSRRNGGGFYNEGTLNVSGGPISGNTATYTDKTNDPSLFFGAGIYNAGTLNLTGGLITGNVAESCGGGVYNYGTMTMSGGVITGNTAQNFSAGGIFVKGTATLNLTGGEISNNSAGQFGGAIACTSTAANAVVISAGIFSGNTCGANYCGSDIYTTTANSSNVVTSYDYECIHFQLFVDRQGARYSSSNQVPANSNVLTAGYGYVYASSGEGHSFGEWTVVDPATCTAAGTSQRVCANCGKVETQTIPATGHTWNAGTVTNPAGCTTTGTKLFTCTVCGQTRIDTLPALGHDTSNATTIPATCTTAGSTSYTCSRCHQTFSETIPATGHTPVTTRINPTCTAAGSVTTKCSVCNTILSTSTLPATGHTPGDWVVTVPATKTSTGLKVKYCTVCNTVLESEEIPMIPDATVQVATVELQSTPANTVKVPVTFIGNEGVWSMGFYVAYDSALTLKGVLAGDVFEDIVSSPYEVDPATDSRASAAFAAAGVPTSGVKCYRFYAENYLFDNITNDGTLCELVFNVPATQAYQLPISIVLVPGLTINADAEDVVLLKTDGAIVLPNNNNCTHSTFVWEVTTPATCTTPGLRSKICTDECGQVLATEVIPATGHSFGGYVQTDAPTCTEAGEETATCANCGATDVRAIPATGHTPGEWVVTVEAHGAVPGEKVKYCTVCNAIVDTEVIPAPEVPALNGSTVEAEGNTSVTANITFENNPGVYSMLLYVYYDEALTLTAVSNGEIFENNMLTVGPLRLAPDYRDKSIQAFNNCGVDMAGKKMTTVYFEEDDLDANATDSGVLVTLTFTTPDVAEGNYVFGVVNRTADIYNSNEDDVVVMRSSGEVQVRESVCDHVWSAWTQVAAPSCTEAGSEQRTCSICGKVETQAIPATGHQVVPVAPTAPTCTEPGYEGGTCSVCGQDIGTVIPALGHEWGDWYVLDDTHMQRECSRCHILDTVEITADPTISIIGTAVQTGDTFTLPIMLTGNPGIWSTKVYAYFDAALVQTASANGEVFPASEVTLGSKNIVAADNANARNAFASSGVATGSYRCTPFYAECNEFEDNTNNGTLFTVTFTAPAQPGTYTVGVVYSQADTINNDEEDVEFALVNAEVVVTEAPPCDHVAGTPESAPATCTEAGYTRVYCTICGQLISETIIPATGHTAGDWEIVTPATANTAGLKVKRCTVCQTIVKQETILPLDTAAITVGEAEAYVGDTFSVPVYIENNPGVWALHIYFTYDEALTLTSITQSGQVFSASEVTQGPLNTDPASNAITKKAFDNTGVSTVGVKTVSLYYESSDEDVTGSGLLFTANFAGVANPGEYNVFIVMRPDEAFNWDPGDDVPFVLQGNTATISEVPACAHANTTTVTQNATCEEAGYIRVTCNDCGAIVSNTVLPAQGHLWSEWTAISATEEQRECSRCHTVETREITLDPTFEIVGQTVEAGETFTVPVLLKNNPGIWSTKVYAYFDAALVQTASANGEVFPASEVTLGSKNIVAADNANARNAFASSGIATGSYRCTPFYAECNEFEDNTNSGTLFTVTFTAPAQPGTYTVGVVYSQADTINNDEEDVEFVLINGEIVVTEAAVCNHVPADAVIENNVDPTCTAAGSYDSVVYCTICGEELSRTPVTVPANGHTAGEAVIENNVDPTCTAAGSYDTVVYCTVCGAEISRVPTTVPANGHTAGEAVIENNIDPTCTAAGSYDTVVYCTVCGAEISRVPTTVPANGHTWDTEWTIDIEPTTETSGEKSHHCIYCDARTDITEIPPISGLVIGDVDGDGEVTARDVSLLKQYMTRGDSVTIVFENSDIDNDGMITSNDLKYLKRYIGGQIDYSMLERLYYDE